MIRVIVETRVERPDLLRAISGEREDLLLCPATERAGERAVLLCPATERAGESPRERAALLCPATESPREKAACLRDATEWLRETVDLLSQANGIEEIRLPFHGARQIILPRPPSRSREGPVGFEYPYPDMCSQISKLSLFRGVHICSPPDEPPAGFEYP